MLQMSVSASGGVRVTQSEFVQILMLLLAVVFMVMFQRHLKHREIANQMVARFCRLQRLQLLDGSVALDSVRWGWQNSRIIQRKSWRFEYTRLPGETIDITQDNSDIPFMSERSAGLLVMIDGQTQAILLADDPELELSEETPGYTGI